MHSHGKRHAPCAPSRRGGTKLRSIVFAILLILVLPAAHAALPVKGLDGITALLAPQDALADEVFTRDANGDLVVDVTVFERRDGVWQQVRVGAALRMAVYDLDGEHDVFSKAFVSSATAPVRLTVPGELVGTQFFDLWVTVARADGTYPTSHHSAAKNALLRQGMYDAADALDYHHVLNPIAR